MATSSVQRDPASKLRTPGAPRRRRSTTSWSAPGQAAAPSPRGWHWKGARARDRSGRRSRYREDPGRSGLCPDRSRRHEGGVCHPRTQRRLDRGSGDQLEVLGTPLCRRRSAAKGPEILQEERSVGKQRQGHGPGHDQGEGRRPLSARRRAGRMYRAPCDGHDPAQRRGLGSGRGDVTGDASWRSAHMAGLLREARGLSLDLQGFLPQDLGSCSGSIDPRRQLDPGGHGDAGWQKTSFIHPGLVLWIVKWDRTFLRVLVGVLLSALADKAERRRLLRALLRFQIVQAIDPNVRSPDFPTRASSLSLIPVGTDGAARCGLREHLLDVARRHPDHLVLATGSPCHARAVREARRGRCAARGGRRGRAGAAPVPGQRPAWRAGLRKGASHQLLRAARGDPVRRCVQHAAAAHA